MPYQAKFVLWTKLPKNLLLANYLISVTAALKWKKRKLMFVSLSSMNIPEYSWMVLYKQDSEYTSGPKYGKILNDGFSICNRYAAIWIYQNMPWQSSEYFLGYKYVRNLNM